MMGILDSIMTPVSQAEDPLKEREKWLGLSQIFGGMTMNPSADQGFYESQRADISRLRDDRKAKAAQDLAGTKLESQKKQMLNMLKGKHPDLAQAMMSGIMTPNQVFMEVNKAPKERRIIKGADEYNYYTDTGKRVLEGSNMAEQPEITPEQLGNINTMRDDLNKELGQFNIIKQGYNNILTFYKDPTAVTDYAIAVAFAKVLDPGSVAREGEVAAVNNAGAKVPAFQAALKNAITGEGSMSEVMRHSIVKAASELYAERSAEAKGSVARYQGLATRAGLPDNSIYMGSPIADPAILPPLKVPAGVPMGVDQKVWGSMSYAQKIETMKRIQGAN